MQTTYQMTPTNTRFFQLPLLLGTIFILGMLVGCDRTASDDGAPEGNAIYYWRTQFTLSEKEKAFLKENDIQTIYLHLFDVVKGADGKPMPDNTLRFDSAARPSQEIVPTVFIAEGLLRDTTIDVTELADRIIGRADKMLTANGYGRPGELQLDYDWAQSDRKRYFLLVKASADRMHKEGRRLSATIRLHQLAQEPPEADYGVLMVYNIGNFADPKEKNSILSIEKLEPYLRYVKSYPLPLATALPLYDWDLLFHQDKFRVIARGVDLEDTAMFLKADDSHYVAKRYGAVAMSFGEQGGARIYPGDVIRRERSESPTVDSAAMLIRGLRPGMLRRTVGYHLDERYLERGRHLFSGNN